MIRSGLLVMALAAVCAGAMASCQSTPTSSFPTMDGEQPPIEAGRYDGPAVTVDRLVQRMVEPPEYVAVAEVTAPTGGWVVTLDHARVTDDEQLRMFLTVEGPGADEIVTQALVTHHVTHRTETEFSSTEVYVRSYRRGETPGGYRRAGP